MDHNSSVIRSTKETFVVKPNVLPYVPPFFFFSLDTFRGKLTSETGMGDGSEGAQLLGLSLPSIGPSPQSRLWFGKAGPRSPG